MYQNARKQEILSILTKRTYATVAALSKELHTSPSSIRRDLSQMETEGLVVRSYGGVELPNAQKHFVPFSSRRHQNSDIKRQMAEKAVTFLESGDVIFLDDSSSAYFVAEKLIAMKDITVVTSSIDVLFLLSQSDIKTYSVGGLIDPENRTCLVGSYATEMIRSIRADWCIFSVKSLDTDGTLTDCVEEGVAVLKNMLAVSKKTMFLCDNSKLGTRSMFVQCMINDLDIVISDSDLPSFLNIKTEKTKFIPV